MRNTLWICSAAVVAFAVVPATALAGGFEFPGAGARPMGRGGAMIARADSPLTLLYDPAGLAELGTSQVELDASLGFLSSCMHRYGNGVSHYANYTDQSRFGTVTEADGPALSYLAEPFPEVCNDGPPGPGAELIGTLKIGDRLGIGFGLLTPLAVGHLVYGDGEGATENGARPSPVRYQLIEEQIILAYPTIGAGYRVTDWLRLGLSFGWGIGVFKFINDTVANPGESPEQDILSKLTASDFFIPQINVSAHFVPIDSLDLVLGFRWTDDVRASGDTDLTFGHFGTGTGPDSTIPTTTPFKNVRLEAPQPWQLYLGARFASRITPRPRDARAIERLSRRVEDSMSNERWDVELDVVYEMNSRVDEFAVSFPEMRPDLANPEWVGGTMMTSSIIIPPQLTIPHRWKDQLSLRLGGDYNVIPGLLAARLGASFETRGVTPEYMGIDFLPMMRVGIHAGVTVRVGRTDISLSYAHFFHESITVAPGSNYDDCSNRTAGGAAGRQVAATGPGIMGCVVNAGTYSASMNAIALSGNYHF